MPVYARDTGTWQRIWKGGMHVRVDGVWREAQYVWVKSGGTWYDSLAQFDQTNTITVGSAGPSGPWGYNAIAPTYGSMTNGADYDDNLGTDRNFDHVLWNGGPPIGIPGFQEFGIAIRLNGGGIPNTNDTFFKIILDFWPSDLIRSDATYDNQPTYTEWQWTDLVIGTGAWPTSGTEDITIRFKA